MTPSPTGADGPADEPHVTYGAHQQSPTGDVLASGPEHRERGSGRRGARRWLAAGLAAVAVLGVGGGVAYGGPALVRLLGGGPQPEDVLPADALLYAELDLNPSAGQKLDAVRFLRKFPETRERFAESKDPRASLWELVAKDEEDLSSIDYGRDVEAWLGERIGVAVLPPRGGEEDPEVAVALQVRDEDRARWGIPKLFEKSRDEDDPGFVVQDGYALFAEDEADARRLAEAGRARSLAENPTFAADAERLGDAGVTSGWIDLSRAAEALTSKGAGLSPAELDAMKESLRGRMTWTVRFQGDDLELAADGVELADTEPYAGPAGVDLGRLPGSTVAAAGLGNGKGLVTGYWDLLIRQLEITEPGARAELEDVEREFGLDLPGDLAVLLGDSFLLAVDGAGLAEEPRVGAKVRTDGARAEDVLRKVRDAAAQEGEQLPVVTRRNDDGLLIAGEESYLDVLERGEDLGAVPAFQQSLPDLASADVAAYVDIDRLAETLVPATEGADDRKVQEALRAVDAIGMTMSSDGKGEAHFRLRVVTR